MQLIAQGAEAKIYKKEENIIKERIKKSYRIEELDEKLRKQRTKTEARLLREARRAGVLIPQVLEEGKFSITMEFIEGKKLRDCLNEVSDKEREKIAEEMGKNIAKLHSANIIHGDLTTSNMILDKNKNLYMIDFGLGFFSEKIEDKATDLSVLRHTLNSTHFKYFGLLWKSIIGSYEEEMKKNSREEDLKKIIETLEKIEKRGRYSDRKE